MKRLYIERFFVRDDIVAGREIGFNFGIGI